MYIFFDVLVSMYVLTKKTVMSKTYAEKRMQGNSNLENFSEHLLKNLYVVSYLLMDNVDSEATMECHIL